MRIAVVGAGAIGGLVAFYLAKSGYDPIVVARAATADQISSLGLTLQSKTTRERVAVRATADAKAAGPQDLVLVGFKAHDYASGLPLLAPLIGPSTTIVPLLNGIPWWYLEGLDTRFGDRRLASVDSEGIIAAALPTEQVLGCVVYIGANRPTPTTIDWNGRKRLILGAPIPSAAPRLAATVALLTAAGIDAEATDDIRAAVWVKLLGNATFNPISALTGTTVDQMIDDPGLRETVRQIMIECLAVARALGVTEPVDIEARMKPAPAMVGVRTSMLQDREAGRPLELGALVDAVVELGNRTGVPTPVLSAVGALTRAAARHVWGLA